LPGDRTIDTPPPARTRIWAISDLHLSLARPRDQTRYGAVWRDHVARIRAAWEERIAPGDTVLLPGDLSWAHSPLQVRPDIDWLAALPGRKVLARGNHDFWWKKPEQVCRVLPADMLAVQGSCVRLDGVLICGTMGHIAPNDPYFQRHKLRSYHRELHWLQRSLQEAQGQRADGEPLILMLHYPPYTSTGQASGFTEVICRFRPDVCVYGHLHLPGEWTAAITGERDGTRYHLVAADYVNMIPQRIWPPE